MANKRKNAKSVNDKNKLNKKKNEIESTDSPLFVANNKDFSKDSQQQEILEEIKEVMTEGLYKQDQELKKEEIDEEEDKSVSIINIPIKNYEENPSVKNKKKKELTVEQLEKKEKREAKKAAYKKTTLKHKLYVLTVLLVLGVFTGSGLGVWYFNGFLKSNQDYSANPADYIQDVDATLTKNFEDLDLSNKESWVSHAQSQGKTPYDLSPVDNYVLAAYNASLATSYEVVGIGSIKTMGQDQYMYSERKFDGSKYSFVSISPTSVSWAVDDVAICDTMDKNGSVIHSYVGTNDVVDGDTTATWKYNASYTLDAYNQFSGVMVDSLSQYIIGEKTVISSSEITTDENGNYVFTLKLDNVYTVLNYVRQVKRTGLLSFYPEFSEITSTITITSDWQLVSMTVHENYGAVKSVAGMTVNAPIDATIETKFKFNEPVTLPQVPPAL